jgi:hypothetical protein
MAKVGKFKLSFLSKMSFFVNRLSIIAVELVVKIKN